MLTICSQACLNLDPAAFRDSFDREPFGYTHNLNELEIFASDSLRNLVEKYSSHSHDQYVAGGAVAPSHEFYSVQHPSYTTLEAFDRLDESNSRILLKRPERYDARFRELLDKLFRQVIDLRGGLGSEQLLRLESAVLISSAATITPFHFDPEINFFAQIEGNKTYHVYSPSTLSEAELERFYIRGVVNIGQVGLDGRDPAHEHVFCLQPGKGLHQPQNAPHWVETCASRSVSYAFVFETDASRARGRVRAFNYYLRKLWLNPARPGAHPSLDKLKASTMQAMIPLRQTAVKCLKTLLRRT